MRRTARRTKWHASGGQLSLAVRYFVLGLLLGSLVLGASLYLQFLHDRNLEVEREAIRLEQVSDVVVRYLDTVALDLTQQASEPAVQTYLRTGLEQDRRRAALELYAFAKYKRRYAQVRLIAADGWEKIRIDHDTAGVRVVPDAGLQNKGQRYYFHDALALPQGQIYVSPLDLNVERGEIERPYRPTLRFALPLRDAAGAVQAILVLNFNAEVLLSRFDQAVAEAYGRVELLNKEGYWLRSGDRSREWGFMFDHGPCFAQQYPALWAKLNRRDQGVISDQTGLLVFTTVYPLSMIDNASVKGMPRVAGQDALRWKIVSEMPDELLLADLWERYGFSYGLAWLLLLLASGVGGWILAGIRLERHQMLRERLLSASVFDAASDAMMLTDADGTILSVNKAFTRQSGYSRDEVVGRRPYLLHSGRQDIAFYQRMWQELLEQGHWQGELWDRRKDGSDYPVWLRIAAIRGDDGKVIAYVGLTSDITAHRQAEEALRMQAHHDHLTGLVSRRLFHDRLAHALAWSHRTGEPVSLCYLDLDRFKPINDRYGHEVGDHVLRVLAQRMHETLRDVDTLARIGGDEFAIILTGQQARDALDSVIDRMQHALREPVVWQGHALELDSSVGIASFPQDAADADELLRKADAAMYAAKEAGGGGKVRYHDGLTG